MQTRDKKDRNNNKLEDKNRMIRNLFRELWINNDK
jgi:hypothetical protein